MSCQIIYRDGKISGVTSPNGSPSKLFQSIASNPHMQTLEEALEVYKNIFSKKFSSNTEDEPTLFYRTPSGETYNTYSEALKNTNEGVIEGVIEESTLFEIDSNTNLNTANGFINNYIKSGLMSDVKVIENGESFLVAEGDEATKAVNEFIIGEDARYNLGTVNRTVTNDGRITIRDVKGKATLSGKSVNFSDFQNMSTDEILAEFPEDAPMILASKVVKENILDKTFGTPTQEDLKPKLNEEELKERLFTLLENMGVSLMSIEEYNKKHRVRNGVEPSANALADIANQIIAFKNGEITVEALSEETAHFIVEAWNEAEITDLLRNIDSTQEYKEFSEFYRDIYGRQGITGEALETLVRKEVLGKILAKAMTNNFSTENSTQKDGNIISYIKGLFDSFVEKVSRLFKTKDENNLINFTNQVNDLLLNQNVNSYLNLELLKEKKFVMYQANAGSDDLLLRQSKGLLQILQQQERDLLRADKGLKSNVKKLRDLEQELSNAVLKDSVVEFLVTAKRQAEYINQSADMANQNNSFLINEEGIVYASLRNSMSPVLSEIKNFLVSENNSDNKDIIEEIDKVVTRVSDITGKINNQDNKILDNIVSRMMIRHSLPESVRQQVVDATKAAKNDTTAFYATFGQLSHARDPLLNLAGTVIHDLEMDANISFMQPTKAFQKKMRELGFTEKDMVQFFDNGYITDIRDWKAFEDKESDIAANLYKKISGTTLTIEQIKAYKRDPKGNSDLKKDYPMLDSTQSQEYNKEYRAEMAPFIESVFDEQYYIEEEKKYEGYNISPLTIRERRDLSSDRGDLMGRVKDVDGKVRFTRQDEIDMKALNIKRNKLKTLYTELGDFKNGVSETKVGATGVDRIIDQDTIESNGMVIEIDRDSPSPEAIIAFDLHKLDLLYKAENRVNPKGLSDDFMVELENIENNEGREEALIFLRLNSITSFSEEYWDSLGTPKSFVDELSKVEGSEEIIEKLRILSSKRKQIIKQYRSQQDSSNTLVEQMSKNSIAQVLVLSEEIDSLFLQGSRMMEDNRTDEEIVASLSENTPNEAYFVATKGKSKQERLQFILENTTTTNKRRIIEFGYALDGESDGKALSKGKSRIKDKFDKGSKEDTILAYAESKIAPHYMRFAPEGYSSLQNRLENSKESILSIAKEMNTNPSLQVNNNFSYYPAEEQAFRNKNFKQDFEGGYFQPKISAFKNQKFEDMFAPNIVNGEIESVGKNKQLYEFYKETLDYHRKSLSSIGELGTHNLWKAPQISKSGINKFVDFIKEKNKGNTIGEALKDALFYRIDDQAYGAEQDGESVIKNTGARYIPKYYLQNLEKVSDVSDDLFYSMTAFAQQAYLHQSRRNYFADMMAIQEAILSNNRTYPDGKSAESTSTAKMFKSAMDAYIFGVKESKQLKVTLPIIGTVDLTKNIRFIHSWIVTRNLGFNAVIPFTSWVTAETSTMLEKYVGEFLNPHSSKLATSEFAKLSTDAIKETMEVNSTARLNVMMEHFGVFDYTRKLENSKYGAMTRFIPKVTMALNQAANFPIIPRIALNVLYDYRVVGEDIINFNQFKDINKGLKTPKEIISDWKLLEGKALYNYINTSDTSVSYDLAKLQQDTGRKGDFETFMKEKEKAVTTKMRELVKIIDGQIPSYEKSAAQRHFFLSFFTTHRGWLAIAYARRFKNKHLNFQTGQQEQGSYRTLANFVAQNFSGLYDKGFKGFIKNSKDVWENADDIERQNMKRVMVELAFLQAVVGIGFLLASMAGDDENKDLYSLQLTNYLYFRLMNETTSSQAAIGQQFYELVQSPIVGADTVKNIMSISKYYDTDEITSGRYAGMYQFQKQLMNVLPGYKSSLDVLNPKEAYDSYKHFNTSVETYNPIWWVLETATE